MWCDLGKSVWSRTSDIFSFLFDWSVHLEKYILLKAPPESDQWFQSYEQSKDSQKNRKQKKWIPFFLAVSHNRFSRLLSDSARSQHICKHNYSYTTITLSSSKKYIFFSCEIHQQLWDKYEVSSDFKITEGFKKSAQNRTGLL